MQRTRTLAAARTAFIVYSGIALTSLTVLSQSTPSSQTANAFEEFFSKLATAHGVGGSRGEVAYIKLMDSLGTMTPVEIAAGIPVIDRQLGSTAEPEDRLAKADAANLLMFISWRPDGPELLAPEMDRLVSMLNDPAHLLSGPAAAALQHLGDREPDVVIPILKAALKAPDVNNKTSVGPGIAVVLLRMAPHSNQVTEDIVQYMRRADLTDNQLGDTIVGIDSSRFIPDALTAELVRCLDRPDQDVKSRALVGIAKSNPAAKDAARSRVQRMADDPGETAHVRRLAAEALRGEITGDPNPPR